MELNIPRHRRPAYFRLAGIFIIVAFWLIFAKSEVSMSGNEASRFAVVEAVGEQGVFYIENTGFRTVDQLERGGHIYSDKPLPLSTAVGLAHGGFYRLTGLGFQNDYASAVYRVDFISGALTSILLFWWLFNEFRRCRSGGLALKWGLALAGIFGTWCVSYGVVLNNHVPAALAALGIYIMAEKFARRPSAGLAIGLGLAVGGLGALDIPCGVFFAPAALAAVLIAAPAKRRLTFALVYLVGVAAVVGGIFTLNFAACGSVLPLYIAGGGGSFTFGLHRKFLPYAFEALFGSRGVFSYQPFLLIGVGFFIFNWRSLTLPERCILTATAAAALFYLAGTDEFGGAAYGFRYLVPLLPIWQLGAGRWLLRRRAWGQKWRGALAGGLIAWGVATSMVGVYAPFCVAFEGYRSPEYHFTRVVRSTFWGNVFCAAFECAPDGAVVRHLTARFGSWASGRFLNYAFLHLKKLDQLPEVRRRFGSGS